jgi:hypothetical protein
MNCSKDPKNMGSTVDEIKQFSMRVILCAPQNIKFIKKDQYGTLSNEHNFTKVGKFWVGDVFVYLDIARRG